MYAYPTLGFGDVLIFLRRVKGLSDRDEQYALVALLYQLRIASGLRQADLAKKLGVPQSFVSKVESGERRLDVLELRKFLAALDADLLSFINALESKINEAQR